MQRDAYAALIKKRHLPRLPVRILQLNGRVTREFLYEEVFLGYKLRRLVLLTHAFEGPDSPAGFRREVVVSNFAKLLRLHDPRILYRLVPLLCTDVAGFAGLRAVCASPGSPFRLDDRRDPVELTHRFPHGCAQRAEIGSFFEAAIPPEERAAPPSTRRLPVNGVAFDGLLLSRGLTSSSPPTPPIAGPSQTHAGGLSQRGLTSSSPRPAPPMVGLLTTHESVGEKGLQQRGLMRDFFESALYWRLRGRSELVEVVRATPRRMHFMAVRRPLGSEPGSRRSALLESAREKQLFVYEMVDEDVYEFAA